MTAANGLDYLVNMLAGRWLLPVEFGVFVAAAGLVQILLYAAFVIRNVVAFYTAEKSLDPQAGVLIGGFFHAAWSWAWKWGLAAAAILAAGAPVLSRALQFPTPLVLWAGSAAVPLLFVRAVTDGALQGTQQFFGFAGVQVAQSVLRLAFTAVFIAAGWKAAGAIFAIPVATAAAMLVAIWFLRPYFLTRSRAQTTPVSWHYSAYTLLGFLVFAAFTNTDALFVKSYFPPQVAGDYGPVVTLAKVNLFLPLALGVVLFPKAAQRYATDRDPRPILISALAATLGSGLALVAIEFLYPAPLVHTVFGAAYRSPGVLVGLAGLAATFFAGINIWINYALSTRCTTYLLALAALMVVQIAGMVIFGRSSLQTMLTVMIACGLMGNIAGAFTTWRAPGVRIEEMSVTSTS